MVVPQVVERAHTVLLELFIVGIHVATHPFNHLLADSDGRSEDVLAGRLLAKDEAEVHMEEVSSVVYH